MKTACGYFVLAPGVVDFGDIIESYRFPCSIEEANAIVRHLLDYGTDEDDIAIFYVESSQRCELELKITPIIKKED